MSIISQSPRTRHQVKQLAAKIARETNLVLVTSRQIDRTFGAGIFPTLREDCGALTPSGRYGAVKPSDFVNDQDKQEWAALSAELSEIREKHLERLQREERDQVWADLDTDNLSYSEEELLESLRFESHGW